MATRYSWFLTSRGMPIFTAINVLRRPAPTPLSALDRASGRGLAACRSLVRRLPGKAWDMKLYADRPFRLTNQVLGDLLVLGWIALWVWAGLRLHDLVLGLAAPGEQAEKAGRTLEHSLGDAAGERR